MLIYLYTLLSIRFKHETSFAYLWDTMTCLLSLLWLPFLLDAHTRSSSTVGLGFIAFACLALWFLFLWEFFFSMFFKVKTSIFWLLSSSLRFRLSHAFAVIFSTKVSSLRQRACSLDTSYTLAREAGLFLADCGLATPLT